MCLRAHALLSFSLVPVPPFTQRLLKLARRAFTGSVNRAWNQWVDVLEHRARLRTLMGRGLNGSVMRAFNSLADHAEEARRMRKIAKRALAENKCVVIGLQTTGEARLNDAVKGETDLDEFSSLLVASAQSPIWPMVSPRRSPSLLAGAVAYAVSAPLYLAKTRAPGLTGLVDRSTGRYATGPHAGQPPACASLARALRAGGVAALWTGAGVLVARGAALTGGQLTAYDATKTGLKARGALREGPALHLVASVHGALWATTLAMPLDNLMARYQAEPGRYRGPWRCAAELVRAEGPAVLMRGWGPMFVRLAPMHVVNATLFEQVRFLVGGGYYE